MRYRLNFSAKYHLNKCKIKSKVTEGYKSKLEGMGKSIREMTSGILYNKERDTLPLIEFKDKDDNIIAKFESHTRDERMVFEK